jgi:DNA-binding MarR family transcriptional regulator
MILAMISSMEKLGDTLQHRGDELHLLREVVRTHQAMMTAFSRNLGMPASQFALMRVLGTAEKDFGVMDIAAQLGVNAAAVTRLVQDMESEGLVRRKPDARDGRRNYVSLSAKGTKLFRELHDRSHALERELVALIGADEMKSAAAALSKVREYLRSLSVHDPVQ